MSKKSNSATSLLRSLIEDAAFMAKISGVDADKTTVFQAAMLIQCLRGRLEAIAEQETPHANTTVKRMASMAREAL